MVLELEDVWLRSEKTLALPKVKKHKVLTDFEIRGKKKAVVAGKERGGITRELGALPTERE